MRRPCAVELTSSISIFTRLLQNLLDIVGTLRDFRLPPRFERDLPPSGSLPQCAVLVLCRHCVKLAVIQNESYGVAASFKTMPCSLVWGITKTHLASKTNLCEMNAVPLLYLNEISPMCFPRIQIWDSYPLTEFPRPSSWIRNETRVIRHPCPLLPTLKLKCSRCSPGMAQRVGRGIALLFHDRGTRRGWVVSSTPRPYFTPGKDPVTIWQEAGWAPGPVWTGVKSRPYRYLIPDRPPRSQSLYWLSYPAHHCLLYIT